MVKTWHIEALAMAAILAAVVIGTGNSGNPVEWLGSVAVFTMTRRMSVADRMSEQERRRSQPSVACYRWYYRYLLVGEALWCAYFLLLGAYSALAGVGLMLGYPMWRKLYRRFRPARVKAWHCVACEGSVHAMPLGAKVVAGEHFDRATGNRCTGSGWPAYRRSRNVRVAQAAEIWPEGSQ